MTYKIISWVTGQEIDTEESLSKAKKACKALGHDGIVDPVLTGYAPLAFVADDSGLVYNPRFPYPKKA